MDLTPTQVARAHADDALAEDCLRRARAAQEALQHPNLDQPSREYLNGFSDGWKDCLRGSEKLLERLRGNTP